MGDNPPPIAEDGIEFARLSGVVAARRFKKGCGIILLPECLVLYLYGLVLQSNKSVSKIIILLLSFLLPKKLSNSPDIILNELCLKVSVNSGLSGSGIMASSAAFSRSVHIERIDYETF